MREIVINIRCDQCGDRLDEEGTEVVKATVRGTVYEGDLCVQCAAVWVKPLRVVRPKTKKPGSPGQQYQCPHCEKSFAKRNGLSRHVGYAHGMMPSQEGA